MASDDKKPNRLVKSGPESETRAVIPIAVKAGAELSGIPFLGVLVGSLADLVMEHIGRTREAMQHQTEQRLADFYSEMLKADGTMDEQVAQALTDDKDFHALMRACVADIEAEKVGAYATLARGIASGVVEKQWRRHFILSLRDLSADELECLRGALIARDNDLIPSQGSMMGQEHFLRAGEPGSPQSIFMSNLAARGLIHEGRLSRAGELFAKACWRSEALTPGSLGYRAWSGHNIAIISYEIGIGALDSLAMKLQSALRVVGAKANIFAVTRDNAQQARMISTMAVMLLGNRSEQLVENLPHLTMFGSKVPTVLVRLEASDIETLDLPLFGTVAAANRSSDEVVAEVCSLIVKKSREMGGVK